MALIELTENVPAEGMQDRRVTIPLTDHDTLQIRTRESTDENGRQQVALSLHTGRNMWVFMLTAVPDYLSDVHKGKWTLGLQSRIDG